MRVFLFLSFQWCAITSASVISCGLCTVGFVLVAYSDAVTGLVLLFVGGEPHDILVGI